MNRKRRLLLNANVTGLLRELRARGYDVELSKSGRDPDSEVQRQADEQSRVVITCDTDWNTPAMHARRRGGLILIGKAAAAGREASAEEKLELAVYVLDNHWKELEAGRAVKVTRHQRTGRISARLIDVRASRRNR